MAVPARVPSATEGRLLYGPVRPGGASEVSPTGPAPLSTSHLPAISLGLGQCVGSATAGRSAASERSSTEGHRNAMDLWAASSEG